MLGIDFHSLSVPANGVLFALGGAIVWIAGMRLAVYADALAERTGIGRAFLGLVLLAGITELPEAVTSLSAVVVGNVPLAVNNLFGGIVIQTAILAIADASFGNRSLTFFTPKPEVLLQGVLLVVLLALVLAGVVADDGMTVAGVSPWTAAVFALYLVAIRIVARYEGGRHWRPVDLPDPIGADELASSTGGDRPSPRRLGLAVSVASLVILLAGSLLVGTADALAAQTDLGSSFLGATLLASTTSLPELSTTLGAVRIRAYGMAFGNIFGSNAIMVALLFVTDVVYREGSILATVDRSAAFAAAMGIVVTAIYLVGLILRRHRSVLRIGVDSLFVLAATAVTVAGLYALRSG